jgi:CBS domain-containing protein
MNDLKVSSMMKTEVITSNRKETLSKVISKMSKGSLHEIPVVDEKKKVLGYFGFDVLSRKKHVPLYTRIERLMVAPPKIDENAGFHDAAKIMLETGFRAVPVVDSEDYLKGILSRTDIIKAASELTDVENIFAGEILTPEPKLLTFNDEVEQALSLMVELNELCGPVVNENGKILGGVLIEDISRGLWQFEEGEYIGDVVGENNKPEIKIGSFISPVATVKKEDSLRRVCEEMSRVNPYLCVVVDESQKPLGVITQYDILKNLVKYTPERGVFVDITGLEITDPFIYSSMVSKIERFVEKIGGFTWITTHNLNLHLVTYEKGGRKKWSLRAKLITDKGLFYVKTHGWDILKCVDEVVERLFEKVTSLKPR